MEPRTQNSQQRVLVDWGSEAAGQPTLLCPKALLSCPSEREPLGTSVMSYQSECEPVGGQREPHPTGKERLEDA